MIEKVFASPFFDSAWSMFFNMKIESEQHLTAPISKRKQLYCVRIDDRIKKNLNRQISLYAFIFLNIQLTNLSKNHALCRSRQSVRRLLRATHSVPFILVLLLVDSREDLIHKQNGFARHR